MSKQRTEVIIKLLTDIGITGETEQNLAMNLIPLWQQLTPEKRYSIANMIQGDFDTDKFLILMEELSKDQI